MSDIETTITDMIQEEIYTAIDDALLNSSEFCDVQNNLDTLQHDFDSLKEEFETLQQSHEELIARIENLLDMNPHLKEEA
jgi:predicted nuclease with TOPRIM domain